MKTKLFLIVLILTIGTSSLGQTGSKSSTSSQPASTNNGAVAIQEVISQVRQALVDVEDILKGKDVPPLTSVELTLKTVVDKDLGGSFKLWIISFGVDREKDQTQSVAIRLEPPNAQIPKKVGAANLTEILENVIVSAVEGAQNAGSTDYPLKFSGLTVNIEFTVQTTGNGSISIPQIVPITADLSGKVKKNATQTLKVVFGKESKSDTNGANSNNS